MTNETLFLLANGYVMPFWLLMIFAPDRSLTRWLMSTWGVIIVLPVLYTVLIFPQLPSVLGLFTSAPDLQRIAALLGSPEGCLVGWVHFLAFDLFIGRWIYLTAQAKGYSRVIVGIALFFTLMMGPIGLLMFLTYQRLVENRK